MKLDTKLIVEKEQHVKLLTRKVSIVDECTCFETRRGRKSLTSSNLVLSADSVDKW
jgi:hypothetical protein